MDTFYLNINKETVLKVETTSSYIKNSLCLFYVVHTGNKPIIGRQSVRNDFCFRIGMRPSPSNMVASKLSPQIFDDLCSANNQKFSFSTPLGSYFTVDYSKRLANISLIKGDTFGEYLLHHLPFAILKMTRLFRIHSVSLRVGKSCILFIGKSGSGKSTLGKLFLKGHKGARIISDDGTLVFSTDNNGYILSMGERKYFGPSCLFFVIRRENEPSRIYSIPPREAIKRIVFSSDLFFNTKDPNVNYRLDTLKKLITESKSFVIINGNDLKDNHKKLSSMIDKLL